MKLIYLLQVVLYAFLMYLGLAYLEVEAHGVEMLSRIAWSASRDAAEMETMLSYTKFWGFCSTGTLIFGAFLYKKKEIGKALIVGGGTLGILLILGFFWLSGIDLKGSYMTFELCGSIQIGINVFFLLEDWIVPFIDRKLKQLFFLIGMLYIGIFVLRFWLLSLKNTIVVNIEEIGRDNYRGMAASFPEEIYFFIIVFVAFFAFTLPMYAVDNNDDRLDDNIRSMLSTLRYALFFSCQFSVYGLNNLDVGGTASMEQVFNIAGLIFIIVCAFLLSVQMNNKQSIKHFSGDILDDSLN